MAALDDRARRDAEEEVRLHLELRAGELEGEGVPPGEARARARREFGDVDGTVSYMAERERRRARSARRRAPWTGLARDLKFALRSFYRHPLVPALVVLTLALGIGANTAVYSLLDALVFRPLPFGDGDRVVRMRDATIRPDGTPWPYNTSARSFTLLRDSGIFQSITAQRYRLFRLTGDGEPAALTGIGVSADWTWTLRVAPLLGRAFTPDEEAEGSDARVVLLGHDLWQRRFGGRTDALGASVTLNGQPYTVVGVMPPRFNYPYGSELWVPDTFDPADASSGPNVAARLRDGETLQTSQLALDALSARAAEEYPDTHRAVRFLAVPQRADLLGNQPRLGWVLLGAVAFLLLIASANIANLLTVRAVGGRRARALHTALGASRWHHLRRLTVESGLLAVVGGALGVVGAGLLLEPMAALSVPATASLGAFFTDLRLDGRVLAFAGATTLGVTLLFGVGPALRALREDPMSELRVGRGGSPGVRRLGAGLVVTEVAMAVVLLAGATLLVRDYRRLQSVDPGFETDGRVVVSLTLPADDAPPGEADASSRLRFLAEVAEGFRALPGVTDVSWVNHLPVTDGSVTQTISAENGPTSEPGQRILANIRAVGPGYFRTMGIRMVEGRAPTDAEIRDGARVVVLSRSAADHYWPGLEAVGRRVRPGLSDAEPTWFTVVGVVGQVREEWELDDTWYVPAEGPTLNRALMVVHSDGPLSDLTRVARSVIWAVDPDQPVERVVRLPELVAETYTSERLGTGVVGSFALVGLLLSVLGIYGVVSYTVSGNLRAMGIRLALGAGGGRVKALVLRQGGALVAGGLGLGTLGAVLLTRVLARFLVGDGRLAVHTLSQGGELRVVDYVGVLCVLGAVALLACYLPARRASRVDPMRILRED